MEVRFNIMSIIQELPMKSSGGANQWGQVRIGQMDQDEEALGKKEDFIRPGNKQYQGLDSE